jgi:hypothetical protein
MGKKYRGEEFEMEKGHSAYLKTFDDADSALHV